MSKKVIVSFPHNFSYDIVENIRELKKIFSVASNEDHIVISDGFHTMDELYDHRITLYIALCRIMYEAMKAYLNLGLEPEKMIPVWRSKVNGDGTTWDGWFILGIYKEPGKQITYHLPISRWGETDFAETLDKSPDFDGHTSDDVLKRLAIL